MLQFKVKSSSVRFSVKGTGALQMQVAPAVVVHSDGVLYEGPYEVTPTVDAQTLATKDKRMTDDLTVTAIPVYCTGNTSGGSTFYIATMDEDPDGGVAVLGKANLGSMIL